MKDSRFILNLEKVKDGHPKLLIIDSANSHLNPNSARNLRQKSVVLAVIPKGCTMYLQALDVDIFSTFKHHYSEAADEFLEKNGPRNKVKLTASQSRVLCTRLTWCAWQRTIVSIDLKKAFMDIGYTWIDDRPITPRALPGYTFDPSSIDVGLTRAHTTDDDEERRIEREALSAMSEHTQLAVKADNRQMKLTDVWKWSFQFFSFT